MDYPNIGLDLFTAPFGGTVPTSKRETPKPQQPKTMMKQQAKAPISSANQSGLPEEKRTEPSLQYPHTEIKASEPTQSQTSVKDSEPEQLHPIAKDSESTRLQTDKTDSESTQSKTDEKASGQPQNPQAEILDSAKSQPEPPKELSLDMSDHSIPVGKPLNSSEDAKRKAHEEAEAKRRAEWDAKQAAKKQAEENAIQKLESMSDDDIIAASTERVRTEVEKLTRRNLKDYVALHLLSVCKKDPAFARKTMNPKKSMIHCFHYINRKAKEYIQQEMEDNDAKPENGVYGGDVPDDLCYQWAENYFNDPNVKEDQMEEETFTPRPYVSTAAKSTKTSKTKKAAKKEPKKKQDSEDGYGQMSFTEVLRC